MSRQPLRSPDLRARYVRSLVLFVALLPISPPGRTDPPAIDPERLLGREAIRTGNLARAREAFTVALARNPHDTDSLIALATVDYHAGQRRTAIRWLRRAEQLDPTNPAVQAALGNATGTTSPQAESRIKQLLHQHPGNPSLQFALGALYARQRRWPEATLAFREACSGDTDNPDYLFNLAISLDHAGHHPEAARYYRSALAAASERPAAFSSRSLLLRLTEIALAADAP